MKNSAMSLSTELILSTAKKHGIVCKQVAGTRIFALTYKNKIEYLQPQPPSINTRTAAYCCSNKDITKAILKTHNISVPKGFVVHKHDTLAQMKKIYTSLEKPLVIKPTNSSLAKNVYANITSQHSYLRTIKNILTYYGAADQEILVEEMFVGTEYRILATRNKIIGIMSRIPANVIGDGVHTIKELVAAKNQHSWRGGKFALHTIILGKTEKSYLSVQGWQVKDILPKKIKVELHAQSTTNIDNGGDTIDHTLQAHTSVNKIALQAIRAIPGLAWAGLDFFAKDITKPQKPQDYTILEINASPNIAWQEFPAVGKRRAVALEYLKVIFPELEITPKAKSVKTISKTDVSTLFHEPQVQSLLAA